MQFFLKRMLLRNKHLFRVCKLDQKIKPLISILLLLFPQDQKLMPLDSGLSKTHNR